MTCLEELEEIFKDKNGIPLTEELINEYRALKRRLIPTPECNVGEGDLTYRQAANAIWNKLAVASRTLYQSYPNKGAALQLIDEAAELANLIVHHQDSGDFPKQIK